MKQKKNTSRFHTIVIVCLVLFLLATLISILFIILNSYGVLSKEPEVTIKANNTYTETLHVATDHDYKPFSYIENGEYLGLDVEMIAEVANRMEMNLELELLDWEDAQSGLLSGRYDVILNMESNAILNNHEMIGTIPTDEKQYVVYGKNVIAHIGELYGMRVAAYNKFDELGINVLTGDSYQVMFEKLLNDELDYIICPIQVGDSFIEKLYAEKTIVSSYQISYMYGCMALRAENTELCAKLNNVIRELQVEGFIEKLDNKWVTRRYSSATVKDVLYSNPTVVALLIVFVQVAVFGAGFITFTIISSRRQKAHAAELQRNLDIIHQQNDELIVAQQKAQAASVAKTNFLFNMSHDIRTPMNAIIGFTNLAKAHINDEKKARECLEKISTSSELLLGLINDILEMARIENGKTKLNLAPENILDVIEQMEGIAKPHATEKNLELVFEKQVEHPWVLCDKLKISQVLMNLISNAVKYTNENGHILVSFLETESTKEGLVRFVIKVRDDGIGMSEEFQEKIFDSFERERTSTVSKIYGTGLGMSITKNLTDLMGGEIFLHSKLGEGSEFTIVLELAATDEIREAEEPAIATTAEAEGTEDKKRRVLVVDDNELNRIIATELLQDMGYETEEACNGQEAVDRIRDAEEGVFDLILMDVQMPVMNGYEATKAIRELSSPLSAVPIIALSANAFEEDKKNAMEAGMDAHMAKPIDVDLLSKTLRDLFHNNHSR